MANSYREIFCYRLKQARQAKGLSQKILGIHAGIDEFVASTRVNRYEKGVHEADIETTHRLAIVLDVPLAFFYTNDDFLADIIMKFEKLPQQTKLTIHNIVNDALIN
ncbi:helix-turn-helix domain-containing protein [Entomomonas sp. E2T0]|uniref:helix-turn-helix domain-containing protein n=1 Tax=Entomomonas sp. E2T0 TaxID=2930213 RepID=UPI00222810D3|nr:helix-turn-helix transcriptional regulator [Entomomonas sp. E2T0]UYZ85075.1 helix-turn-helix domain-containing protein [Entomomonas sp. E2T0]